MNKKEIIFQLINFYGFLEEYSLNNYISVDQIEKNPKFNNNCKKFCFFIKT